MNQHPVRNLVWTFLEGLFSLKRLYVNGMLLWGLLVCWCI